jgi:hypothetical protein
VVAVAVDVRDASLSKILLQGCAARLKNMIRFRRRLTTSRMKRDARHQVVSLNHSDDDDPICNDAELRRTIEKVESLCLQGM